MPYNSYFKSYENSFENKPTHVNKNFLFHFLKHNHVEQFHSSFSRASLSFCIIWYYAHRLFSVEVVVHCVCVLTLRAIVAQSASSKNRPLAEAKFDYCKYTDTRDFSFFEHREKVRVRDMVLLLHLEDFQYALLLRVKNVKNFHRCLKDLCRCLVMFV